MDIKDLQSGKVKLEFGNQEQVKVIDEYQEGREHPEDKHYRVEVEISGEETYYVWARNEDEAWEKIEEEGWHYDIETEIERVDIKEEE